jgi:hypothetical protein
MANQAERHDNFDVPQTAQFVDKIRPAVGELFGQWFVVGRRAMHGRGDVAIDETQSVVAIDRLGLVGKSETVKRSI